MIKKQSGSWLSRSFRHLVAGGALTGLCLFASALSAQEPAPASDSNAQVYDLELTPDWHQVALFNAGSAKQTIAVPLSGDRVTTGALGLDPAASYYVYDFWRDELLGKLPGTAKIERQLSPSCCAMLSVRKAQTDPQVLSTNRHVLQGWMELSEVKWDATTKKLSGKASLIGGEAMRIAIAGNGFKTTQASAANASAKLEPHPAGGDIAVLVLESTKTGQVSWSIEYQQTK